MSVRVLHDQRADEACLFQSTAMWAFGPVFHADKNHDAAERADAFLRWINANPPKAPIGRMLGSPFSICFMKDHEIESAYADWLGQEAEQWKREEEAEAA